jgi:hypothetical protein
LPFFASLILAHVLGVGGGLLALHCLANFGTCLGGVLLALLALLALLSLANFGTCLGGGLLA